MRAYTSMTKAELIAELELRDARLTKAEEWFRSNRAAKAGSPRHPTCVTSSGEKKQLTLKPVKSFETKEVFLEWAAEKAGSFVVTHNDEGRLVANLKTWVTIS